jgi:hypothetical protein
MDKPNGLNRRQALWVALAAAALSLPLRSLKASSRSLPPAMRAFLEGEGATAKLISTEVGGVPTMLYRVRREDAGLVVISGVSREMLENPSRHSEATAALRDEWQHARLNSRRPQSA